MAYLMIVDDDEDFAEAVAASLAAAGHEVEIEPDPAAAMERMSAHAPDLVILDVMFPEDASGGFTLAGRIRQQSDALKKVPILMLTALNDKYPLGFSAQDLQEGGLGVSDFLEKSGDLDLLGQRVAKLLAE
jgi:two-component system, OmpR family, response regulator MprA